jgi:hypothetical protein
VNAMIDPRWNPRYDRWNENFRCLLAFFLINPVVDLACLACFKKLRDLNGCLFQRGGSTNLSRSLER